MIKRTFLALAFLAGLLSPAYSAGTIGLSLTQRFDAVTTKPLNGGKLYFIQAGTTSTPQNAFQDSALTIPWPNPMTLDAAGNVPQLFFADGQIKIRLTNAVGVNQLVADNILVIGPSSGGGGGGGTVDPTTVIATGDIKTRYGIGVLSGFVRLNGRTIGSVASGATERANSDCQALFEYLWNNDGNRPVSGGRGASSNADWLANKTITLPDGRGRVLAGLDDMGSSAAGILTQPYFGNLTTTLGNVGGTDSWQIVQSQLPPTIYPLQGANSAVSVQSSLGNILTLSGAIITTNLAGGVFPIYSLPNGSGSGFITSTGTFTPQGTIGPLGSGVPHPLVQPTLLVTNYIKL